MSDIFATLAAGTARPTATTGGESAVRVVDPSPELSRLATGESLRGTVVGKDDQGHLLVRTRIGVLQLATPRSLPVGSEVVLQVRSVGPQVVMSLLPLQAAAGGSTPAPHPGAPAPGTAGPGVPTQTSPQAPTQAAAEAPATAQTLPPNPHDLVRASQVLRGVLHAAPPVPLLAGLPTAQPGAELVVRILALGVQSQAAGNAPGAAPAGAAVGQAPGVAASTPAGHAPTGTAPTGGVPAGGAPTGAAPAGGAPGLLSPAPAATATSPLPGQAAHPASPNAPKSGALQGGPLQGGALKDGALQNGVLQDGPARSGAGQASTAAPASGKTGAPSAGAPSGLGGHVTGSSLPGSPNQITSAAVTSGIGNPSTGSPGTGNSGTGTAAAAPSATAAGLRLAPQTSVANSGHSVASALQGLSSEAASRAAGGITASQGGGSQVGGPQAGGPQGGIGEMANSNPAGSLRLTGLVTATTSSGQPILHTPLGTLTLDTRAALPPGSSLALQITLPVTQETPAALALAAAWPSLESLEETVFHGLPAAQMEAVARALPQVGPRLASGMLFFLSALNQGNLGGWLSPAAAAAERGEHGDLFERLGREFAGLSRSIDTPAGEWRFVSLPLWSEQGLRELRCFFRHQDHGGGKDKGGEKATRFVLELELDRHGELQLDGLVRARRFDLMLRSRRPLPALVRGDLMALFEEANAIAGYTGQLVFQASNDWLQLLAAQSADRPHEGVRV